ncbi:Zinc finger protein [Nesidiocoris tenuis]|uniref:Zinc finger protein n=1 Tax=Nesidiocoris tenuis TaxID=355587 RepID=A0ABN7B452_9HEMI|nr:Zinc finger protein [Nesidiocoris tenuis]
MAKSGTIFMATGNEGLLCYVCGSSVKGRYYNLASCRTQATKIRLIEKLGQLVGDDFLVIVSEEDTICKGCATMINSLDRLEKELTSLRTLVLKYIEKKYQISEGELVNSRANITPCPTGGGAKSQSGNGNNGSIDFLTRKKRAMYGEINPDDLKDTKDSIWLQCDRCKFTTPCNPNVHGKSQKAPTAPKMAPPMSIAQDIAHAPMIIQEMPQRQEKQKEESPPLPLLHVEPFGPPIESRTGEDGESEVKKDMANETENVELITADIGDPADFQDENLATIEPGQMLQMTSETSGSKQVTLQSIEGEDGQNTLCMVDENGMIVQRVEQAEDGTLYVQMPDGSDPTKQMLSVAEDGSVQMVEVLWGDDMGQTDDTEATAHGIVNF